MSGTLEKTIRILASSKGKAARRALHDAVSSSEPALSLLASREALAGNNTGALFELIKKFDQLAPEQYHLLASHADKLGQAIFLALLNDKPAVQENALAAIRQLRPYSLIPLLLQHLSQGPRTTHLGVVQWATYHLVDLFSQEFQGRLPCKIQYSYTLAEISYALERAIASWQRHERAIFLDVFFRLSERLDGLGYELREMTCNTSHPAHAAFVRKLLNSSEPLVMRFLVRQLDTTVVPKSLLSTVPRRSDHAFIRMLLDTVGYCPSVTLRENLSRIRNFEWLGNIRARLEELDEGCHHFLAELVRCSGMSEQEKMVLYESILRFGKRPGKTAVLKFLRPITAFDADRLILFAAESDDPEVQVAALAQLRERNIRGATGKLLACIESPHEQVRQTAAAELTEFRMDRLLQSLDALSEEQRRYMVRVIKIVDPRMRETIARELENPAQEHKDFLLTLITGEKTVAQYELSLMKLVIQESDPSLRFQAVKLLALGGHESSRHFLKRLAERDSDAELRLLAKRIYEIRGKAMAKG